MEDMRGSESKEDRLSHLENRVEEKNKNKNPRSPPRIAHVSLKDSMQVRNEQDGWMDD